MSSILADFGETETKHTPSILADFGESHESKSSKPSILQDFGESPSDTIAGYHVVGINSDDPIHYGTHTGGGVFDITWREAKRRGMSLDDIAQDLASKGYVAAVRHEGQRGITSDHIHFVDPAINKNEAQRLANQHAQGVKGIHLAGSPAKGSTNWGAVANKQADDILEPSKASQVAAQAFAPKPVKQKPMSGIERGLHAQEQAKREKIEQIIGPGMALPHESVAVKAMRNAGLEVAPVMPKPKPKPVAVQPTIGKPTTAGSLEDLVTYALSEGMDIDDFNSLIANYPEVEQARYRDVWKTVVPEYYRRIADSQSGLENINQVMNRTSEVTGNMLAENAPEILQNEQAQKNLKNIGATLPYFIPGVGQGAMVAQIPELVTWPNATASQAASGHKPELPIVSMAKEAVHRLAHPVETINQGQAINSVMDLMLLHGLGKSALGFFKEGITAARSGDGDLAANRIVEGVKRTDEYKSLPQDQQIAIQDSVAQAVKSNSEPIAQLESDATPEAPIRRKATAEARKASLEEKQVASNEQVLQEINKQFRDERRQQYSFGEPVKPDVPIFSQNVKSGSIGKQKLLVYDANEAADALGMSKEDLFNVARENAPKNADNRRYGSDATGWRSFGEETSDYLTVDEARAISRGLGLKMDTRGQAAKKAMIGKPVVVGNVAPEVMENLSAEKPIADIQTEDLLEKRLWEVPFNQLEGRFRRDEHKSTVEKALSNGRPVPPEVLTDYSDLAAKYQEEPQHKTKLPPNVEGSVAPREPIEAEPLPEPEPKPTIRPMIGRTINERDIVKTLVDATGQPHRKSRMGAIGSAVQGIYKRGIGVSRARDIYDVTTAAHEIGHGLNDKYKWSTGDWDSQAMKELERFGKPEDMGLYSSWDPSKGRERLRSEGVAEVTRSYIQSPGAVAKVAPHFLPIYEKALQEAGILDAVKEAQMQWKELQRQGPLETIRANTDYDYQVSRSAEKSSKWHGFRTDVVDDLFPIRKVTETATGKRYEEVAPSENPYILARLSRGSSEIAHKLLTVGNDKIMGLQQILKLSDDKSKGFRDFQDYARARRLKAYAEDDRPTAMLGKSQIDAVIDHYESPKFRDAFGELQRWVDEISRIERNFYTQDSWERWKQTPDYIPMHRVQETGIGESIEGKIRGVNRKFGNQKINYFGYQGTSQAPFVPWLDTLVDRAYSSVQKASQNNATLALVDMMQKQEGHGKIIERVPESVIPKDLGETIRRALSQMKDGEDIANALPDELFDLKSWEKQGLTAGMQKERILFAMREGKPEFYKVADPALYDAVAGMRSSSRPLMMQIMAAPANTLRAGITLDPGFLFYANLIRDSIHSYMVSEGGFIPFWDTAKGAVKAVKGGDVRERWVESGGALSSTGALDREQIRKHAADLGNSDKNFKLIEGHVIDGVRRLRDASEAANRIATFERERVAVDKKHPEWSDKDKDLYAAYRSRDLLDFAMKGRLSSEATYLIAFARSNINGMAKMGHEIARDPRRILIHGAPLVVATTMLYAANRDNDEYWKLSEWERSNYWHAPLPNKEFVRIPKPYDWGFVFGTSVEDSLRNLADKDPHSFDSLMRAASDAAAMDMPNLMQLGIDLAGNRQSFSGAPIVSPYSAFGNSAVRPEDQYRAGTSPTFKRLGGMIGVSPAKMEYAAKQAGGQTADYTITLVDWMLSPLTDEKPTRSKSPLRRVTTHRSPYTYLQDELMQKAEQATKDYNSARKAYKTVVDAAEIEKTPIEKRASYSEKAHKAANSARDDAAKRYGYKDWHDLQTSYKAMMKSQESIYDMQDDFYNAESPEDQMDVTTRIQETARKALNAHSGKKYRMGKPMLGIPVKK